MPERRRWVIEELTTYADSYEVLAYTREEALERHRAGESNATSGVQMSEGELISCEPAIWYVGPESKVYHTREDCPRLWGKNRYYHRTMIGRANGEKIMRERKECSVCQNAS